MCYFSLSIFSLVLNCDLFYLFLTFRADLLNRTEREKTDKINRLIEKEHRFQNNIQNKVIERTTKILKEKQALLQLLNKEYKIDNFITMKTGFDANQIESKHDARHYIIESRIFNSGFNTKSMRPEISRQLRKLDPNRRYRVLKKRLLAENKCKNVEMNRAISSATFTKMLKDKDNWTLYNHPSDEHRTGNVTHIVDDKFTHSVGVIPEKDENVEREGEKVIESDKQELQEKETVLEKRLPRRQADAFSMTMRTLGPVYFQSSSYQLPKTEDDLRNGE